MNKYRFKRSFSEDPTLSDRLFNLLETTFPGISGTAKSGRTLGASWEAASTPFIRFHDDLAVTHVGVLEIPMQLIGKTVTVGGIHAVCTRPDFRRRGDLENGVNQPAPYTKPSVPIDADSNERGLADLLHFFSSATTVKLWKKYLTIVRTATTH